MADSKQSADPFAPREVIGVRPDDAPRGPNYALWLWYLYARPRVFFTHFVRDHLPLLTAVAAWLYGMASAADRAMSMVQQPGPASALLGDSWGVYLGVIAVMGVFSGAVYFLIGGWWYRVRLRWSGAVDPDKKIARRVYVHAAMVHALPTCLFIVWQALNFARPADAVNSWIVENAFFGQLLFIVWSFATSYVGVTTVFEVRGFRPVFWFLLMPLGLVVGAFMVGVVAAIAMGGFGNAAPSVSTPAVHRSGDVEFSYPGNWDVETTDPEYVPGEHISLWMPNAGRLTIMIYASDDSDEVEAENTITSWRDSFGVGSETPAVAFEQWGAHRGAGREIRFKSDGQDFIGRVFVTEWGEGRRLEAHEIFVPEDRTTIAPGFEQVAATLRRRPPPSP